MRLTIVISMCVLCLFSSSAFAGAGDLGAANGANGSESTPWLIEDFEDFQAFSNDSSIWTAGQYIRLEANLDLDPALDGRVVYTRAPIAGDENDTNGSTFDGRVYSGNFDGNGKTISNLTVNGTSYCGLFGKTDSGSIIIDLGIENGSITGSGDYVGGLVGDNSYGNLSNCYSSGTVTGEDHCYSVGGLVGDNSYGNLSNCYSSGTVNSSGYYVGGLVGYISSGSLSNCYSSGTVNGSSYDVGGLVGYISSGSLSNCYSSGTVNGSFYSIGSLVGYNNSGSLINCYFYIYGGPDNGYGLPLDDDQLQMKSSFSGFDFAGDDTDGSEDHWVIEPGYMPRLTWQNTPGLAPSYLLEGITTSLSGSGYPDDPFIIGGYDDLMEFRNNTALRIGCYSLTSNIDLGGVNYTQAFIPEYFTGEFRGNGHRISNLVIDGESYLGFFSILYGAVDSLSLENVFITGSGHYVGGLVGYNNSGSLSNCHSSGNVNGSGDFVGGLVGKNSCGTLSHCYSSGIVTGSCDYVGGLVGRNSGSLSHCYSSGTVNGDAYVGGLAGENRYPGNLGNCYSSGTVNGDSEVGGLVGDNFSGRLSNCYSSGNVNGSSDYIGGLVGVNFSGHLSNCYSSSNVKGDAFVGGLVGYNSSSSLSNCYSSGTVNGSGDYVGGLVGVYIFGSLSHCFWDVESSGIGSVGDNNYGAIGKTTAQMQVVNTFINADWDFVNETANGTSEIWQMPELGGYPIISSFNGYIPVLLDGQGSQSYPYLISNAIELGAVYHYDSSAYYKLTADIELDGIQWSTAVIPLLKGHFDGDGHIINNLTISGGGYLGLFGEITGSAEIFNIGLEYISITVSGDYVGGLVGLNYGSLNNCYSSGTVNGDLNVGGLVGLNYGSLNNCYSSCTVTSSGDTVGGLVGSIYSGLLINCYSTGTVNGSGDYVGGLVGKNYSGRLSNCFWDVESSGIGTAGDDNYGAIGKTTAEMQTKTTFTAAGWDYVNETDNGMMDLWYQPENSYPKLFWQATFGDANYDEQVDMNDLSNFCDKWLTKKSDLPENQRLLFDFNFDDEVNTADFAQLSNNWLEGK
ncbi:MAG: hypothetical protein K9M57_00160 [Phycisphaerae bacterium]|nr:hypothetical protein [Phycisphaerae bacterium]